MEKPGFSWIQARRDCKYEVDESKHQANPSLDFEKAIANPFGQEALRANGAQSIANTVWAYETLKMEAPKLLAAIDALSGWLVENGNAQKNVNTCGPL